MYFADEPAVAAPVPVLGRWAAVATVAAGAAVLAVGLTAGPLLNALSAAQLLP
jgi:hypothetical protein